MPEPRAPRAPLRAPPDPAGPIAVLTLSEFERMLREAVAREGWIAQAARLRADNRTMRACLIAILDDKMEDVDAYRLLIRATLTATANEEK